MSISYVQSDVSSAADTNTRAVTLTGVTAGNLIVAVLFWEGPHAVSSFSDGTSSLVAGTSGVNPSTIDGTYDLYGCPYYLLSANGGNKTYTVTMDATCPVVSLHVAEFSKTEGTFALDGQSAWGYGYGTTHTSGALTTSGTNIMGIGFSRNWTSCSYSNETIGGSAATEMEDNGVYSGCSFYRAATLSSGTAVATGSSTQYWAAGLIAFSADVGLEAPTIAVSQVGADILVEWS